MKLDEELARKASLAIMPSEFLTKELQRLTDKVKEAHVGEKGVDYKLFAIAPFDPRKGTEDVKVAEIVLSEFPAEYEDKISVLMQAGIGMAKAKMDFIPCALFMITEAWMKVLDKAKGEKWDDIQGKVSEQPDKKEVIIITVQTADGRSGMSAIHVTRDENGGMIFGEVQFVPIEDKPSDIADHNSILTAFFYGYGRQLNKMMEEHDATETKEKNEEQDNIVREMVKDLNLGEEPKKE